MTTTIDDIKKCVKQWQSQGIDLDGYNTKQSAMDLVALTKALGVEKVNLWGISYGTHLAFATAKYHPAIINKMVLASSEGLNHTIKRPARVQALLENVDLMLKQDPDTAEKYPDLLGMMKRVLDKVSIKPEIVKTKSFRKKDITVGISKIDLQFALSYIFLRDPEYLKQMPRMFNDMDKGNFAEIGSYIAYIKSMSSSNNPMGIAMDSASGISAERWKLVQQEAKTSLVGRTTNFPFPDINHVIPVKDLGDEFREEVVTDIPTLFLAGTLDGRTLYQSQMELTKNFSNRQVITIEGAGHNLFMSHPDVTANIYDFLNANTVNNKTPKNQTIKLAPIQFQ